MSFTPINVKGITDVATRTALTNLNSQLAMQPSVYTPVVMDSLYTTPMYLALDAEPRGGILCVRVRQLPDLETVVAHDCAVAFVWDGAQTRVKINAIGGMVTGTGKTYRFNFLVVG
jgi:hypothetical protein